MEPLKCDWIPFRPTSLEREHYTIQIDDETGILKISTIGQSAKPWIDEMNSDDVTQNRHPQASSDDA